MRPQTRRWIQFVLLLAGCQAGNGMDAAAPGQDSGANRFDLAGVSDLAFNLDFAQSNDINSPSDMITPADLFGIDGTGFCGRYSIAGTCLQTFFGAASACFASAGDCHVNTSHDDCTTTDDFCWNSGATYSFTIFDNPSFQCEMGVWSATWKHGNSICMTEQGSYGHGGGEFWGYLMGGQGLSWADWQGWSCPDGSILGGLFPDLWDCKELKDLLKPDWQNCNQGGACAQLPDGGVLDGGAHDAGVLDGSPNDGGTHDGGAVDGSANDATAKG